MSMATATDTKRRGRPRKNPEIVAESVAEAILPETEEVDLTELAEQGLQRVLAFGESPRSAAASLLNRTSATQYAELALYGLTEHITEAIRRQNSVTTGRRSGKLAVHRSNAAKDWWDIQLADTIYRGANGKFKSLLEFDLTDVEYLMTQQIAVRTGIQREIEALQVAKLALVGEKAGTTISKLNSDTRRAIAERRQVKK